MPAVDLAFSVRGNTVPSDHGYSLYAALSRELPAIHGAKWLGIHPLSGTPVDDVTLRLRDKGQLQLRLPVERIADVLPLAGKALAVAGQRVVLGTPHVFALEPAASLDARLVIIKLTEPPHRHNELLDRESLDTGAFLQRYLEELKRQLTTLEIAATPELCGRGRITVSGKCLVGYSVRVSGRSAAQSLRLQEAGLGGKRRMGCGMFRPTRGR
jgi:CRISPR-associated protein Cas6